MFARSVFDRCVFFSATIGLSLPLALVFLHPPPAAAAKESAWNLTVQHSYFHLCKAVVSESKATFTTGTFAFAVLPPDYKKLYVLNPAGHLYLETTLEKWFISSWRKQNLFAKYVRAGEATLCGLKCVHYLCLDKDGHPQAEFWTTKSISAKREMADSFCTICGVPTGLGVPVRFSVMKPEARRLIKFVDPVSATKAIVNSETAFLPPDFKKATDRYALFVSQNGKIEKSDLEDLFRYHFKATDK
jgi:hypothetical protein